MKTWLGAQNLVAVVDRLCPVRLDFVDVPPIAVRQFRPDVRRAQQHNKDANKPRQVLGLAAKLKRRRACVKSMVRLGICHVHGN